MCGVLTNVLLVISKCIWCGEMDRIRNSCPLSMEIGNKSRYLIFLSLGTLTDFRESSTGTNCVKRRY
jgi:hypothetical protein